MTGISLLFSKFKLCAANLPGLSLGNRTILEMKIQRDKIKQYLKRIQAILDRENEIAGECLRKGDKDRARLALRRRKYQEQLLKKADEQLERLEELTSVVEFSLIQKDVLYGLQQGNAALKEIQKEMSLEAVERIMDETAEGIAYQKVQSPHFMLVPMFLCASTNLHL